MKYLDLSFPDPPQNLACDEALLDICEEGDSAEILRFWQSDRYFVVLGYSNKIRDEVNLNSCGAARIPIFRRITGGGTVLQGPGCLNYSLILDLNSGQPVKDILQANHYVMQRHQQALEKMLNASVEIHGDTDLALNRLKFSGNAQRRKRNFMLFHGTFLTGMDFSRMEDTLPLPLHRPDYRKNRPHQQFLMNLALSPDQIKNAIAALWDAHEIFPETAVPWARIESLVREKYNQESWNSKY